MLLTRLTARGLFRCPMPSMLGVFILQFKSPRANVGTMATAGTLL